MQNISPRQLTSPFASLDISKASSAVRNFLHLLATDDQLLKVLQRYQMVLHFLAGLTMIQARRLAGLADSLPTCYRLVTQFRSQGIDGLVDQRWLKPTALETLDRQQRKILYGWWFARPAAGYKVLYKLICETCASLQISPPSLHLCRQFFASRSYAENAFRSGLLREWERRGFPVIRFETTTYANERWQIDSKQLDIWAKVFRNGQWVPVPLHIMVTLDSHSRAITGFILSTSYQTSWMTALLLRKAILPKTGAQNPTQGLCTYLQPDRGSEFINLAIKLVCLLLRIILIPDPPYYPNSKGKVERWFQTLDKGCLRGLPGHFLAVGKTEGAARKALDRLLTPEQIQAEITSWIDNQYHLQRHSETKRSPLALWQETVRLRLPHTVDELDLCLLKADQTRTVRNTGIDFRVPEQGGGRYWCPEIVRFAGHQVSLRYNPEDLTSILIYSQDQREFIGEAWLMQSDQTRYTIEDIKQARRRFKKGLLARLKDYAAFVEQTCDVRAAEAAWEARHLAARTDPSETSPITEEKDELTGAQRLLAELKAKRQGELS
jgi:putative transposase